MQELTHPWDYKHNFELTTPPSKHASRCRDSHCKDDHSEDLSLEDPKKKKLRYKHRWVNICGNIKNVVGFVMGCQKEGGGLERPQSSKSARPVGGKNEGGFIELSDLSSKRGDTSKSS
jgi:hypothetical protein